MRFLNPFLLTIVGLMMFSNAAMAKNASITCFAQGFSTMNQERIESLLNSEQKVELSQLVPGISGPTKGSSVTVKVEGILYKYTGVIPDSEMNDLASLLLEALRKISDSSDERDLSFRGCTVDKIR